MSRKDEYREILKELDNTPIELEYTLVRAEAKIKSKRGRRFFMVPLSSIATFLIVFTIVLNSSITFVEACLRIPVLKDFAQLLIFSPSLSAAIENEYVQPMKLKQTKDDVTARVEYVIVDQKQLNIFYTVDSKVYPNMAIKSQIKGLTGKDIEGYWLSTNSFKPNGELNHITVEFQKQNMPNGIELNLTVSDKGELQEEKSVSVADGLMGKEEEVELDDITEFTFELEFDPYYTDQGQVITLNKDIEIDNQILTITTTEIYPTHIRLNFEDDKNNTAWLQSFQFHLENEIGERYDPISNGVSATGSQDSPMMASHRLESDFFSKSKKLTLHINGVKWLDKDVEKVKLDLKNKTIEALPETVVLENIERKDGSWLLKFSAKETSEGSYYQLWRNEYYDMAGNVYHINTSSASSSMTYNEESKVYRQNPGRFDETFALLDYPYDMVYLAPVYSRIVNLPTPIIIGIK